MEAVLTNGIDCVALVEKSFHWNFRKDEGYTYIHTYTYWNTLSNY